MTQRNKHFVGYFAGAFLLIATLGTAKAQSFIFFPVVSQGQRAPGTDGKFLNFYPSPLVNDSGAIAFRAAISGSVSSGLFLFSNGAVTPIALQGQPAPGTGGGVFKDILSFALNNSADIAFRASLGGSSSEEGLFLFSKGEVSPVALSGQNVPGTNLKFFRFGGISINDFGSIAFSSAGIIFVSFNNIFLPGDRTFLPIAFPDPSKGIDSVDAPSLNNKNGVAFLLVGSAGPATGGQRGRAISLYFDGSVFPLAWDGLAAPGTGGGVFYSGGGGTPMGHPFLNDGGSVAFFAAVLFGNTNGGIFFYSGGSFSPVVLAREIAPGTGNQVLWAFDSVSLNNAGLLGFIGMVLTNNGDLQANGLFLFDRSKVVKVAISTSLAAIGGVAADEAPGTEGGKFSGFNSVSLNNANTLVFRATVSGGNTSEGIFLATHAQRPRRRP